MINESYRRELAEDSVFYFVYAILHSIEYRSKFKFNLTKDLPRIPTVETADEFQSWCDIGRALMKLHAEFESVVAYPVVISKSEGAEKIKDNEKIYRVERMKFAGTRGKEDKTTVIYNDHITIENIPLEAYEYVVNGKPALEWVMERQCVKVDKDSGIVNDANDYANETMNNPAYPLELFQRVITVSLETMKIVRSLPKLDL